MGITALQPWPITDIVGRIHLPLVAKAITFGLCLLPNPISGEQCVFTLSGNQLHGRKTGSARRWWDSSLVGQIKEIIRHISKRIGSVRFRLPTTYSSSGSLGVLEPIPAVHPKQDTSPSQDTLSVHFFTSRGILEPQMNLPLTFSDCGRKLDKTHSKGDPRTF